MKTIKTSPKNGKSFDAVKSMRENRDKFSLEIADMSLDEIKAYLKDKKVRLQS